MEGCEVCSYNGRGSGTTVHVMNLPPVLCLPYSSAIQDVHSLVALVPHMYTPEALLKRKSLVC